MARNYCIPPSIDVVESILASGKQTTLYLQSANALELEATLVGTTIDIRKLRFLIHETGLFIISLLAIMFARHSALQYMSCYDVSNC